MNKSDSFENDELISAYLDGEVTDEERALVENDPSLIAKVKQMRAVVDATSSLAHTDPSLREKHLTEAISEFKKTTNLLPFRRRKTVQRGLILTAVAAAAVAVFALPVFDSQRNNSDNGVLVATGLVNETDTANDSRNGDIEEQEMSTPEISEAEISKSTLSENEISQSTTKEEAEGVPLTADEVSISEEGLDSSDDKIPADEIAAEATLDEESTKATSTNVEESLEASANNPFSFDAINTYAHEDPELSSNLFLINARTETREESDLFIIELSDSLTEPSASASLLTPAKYAAEWRALSESDSEENSLRGPQGATEFLVIKIAAQGFISTDEGSVITWEPTDGLIQTDGGRINGIYNGNFEESLIFVLGTDARYPFRVFTKADPPRLIVEIKISQ